MLLQSMVGLDRYAPMIFPVSIFLESLSTWFYNVMIILIEHEKFQILPEVDKRPSSFDESRHAAIVQKTFLQ